MALLVWVSCSWLWSLRPRAGCKTVSAFHEQENGERGARSGVPGIQDGDVFLQAPVWKLLPGPQAEPTKPTRWRRGSAQAAKAET